MMMLELMNLTDSIEGGKQELTIVVHSGLLPAITAQKSKQGHDLDSPSDPEMSSSKYWPIIKPKTVVVGGG